MCPRPDNFNQAAAKAATPASSSSADSISLLITPPSQSTQLLNESTVCSFKRSQRSRCSRFFGCVGRGIGNLLLLPFRVLFFCACKICAAVKFVFCCGRSNTPPAVVYPNYAPAGPGAFPPGGEVNYAKQSLAGPNPLLADDSPAHWEPLDHATKAHGNTSLVLLSKDKHAEEIAEVIKNFERTGPKGVIKTVHRVQNKSILANYLRKREEMVESGVKRGKVSEIRADIVVFHGTRMTPPSKIHASASGFDPSLGMSAPNWLWFASEARYSAQGFAHSVVQDKMPFYGPGNSDPPANRFGGGCMAPQNGTLKQIFQVRITMDCNPPPQTVKPAPDRFGVVRTNTRQCLVGPNIYTLMDGSQCLPEYLITFS